MTAEPIRRERLAQGLYVLALLLMVVGALGLLAGGLDGQPVLLLTLNQPVVVFGASAAAFLAALLAGARPGQRGVFRAAPVLLVLVAVVGVFGFDRQGEETRRNAAPGRADRELVLERDSGFEPYVRIYVEQGSGFTARRWEAGAVGGDQLLGVEWDGPDRIKVTTDGYPESKVQLIELAPGGAPRSRAK